MLSCCVICHAYNENVSVTHLNSTSLICYETSFTMKNHATKLLDFVALFITIVCGMIRCLHFCRTITSHKTQGNIESERFALQHNARSKCFFARQSCSPFDLQWRYATQTVATQAKFENLRGAFSRFAPFRCGSMLHTASGGIQPVRTGSAKPSHGILWDQRTG